VHGHRIGTLAGVVTATGDEGEVSIGRELVHVRAGEGLPLWVPEALPGPFRDGEGPPLSRYTLKATSDRTGGALTVLTADVAAGNGPPVHRHPDADESFYVLDGSFEATADSRQFTLTAGDFLFIPRGTEHGWHNSGDGPARILVFYTPSDMEEFFAEAGRLVEPGEAAERLTQEDARRAEAAARRRFGPAHTTHAAQ
jgi:quercetin dioxygenase-like cupin family protein